MSTIFWTGTINPALCIFCSPCECLAGGTFDDSVFRVVLKTSYRDTSGFAVFLLWWNNRIDIFVFEKFKVPAVCVGRIGGDRLDLLAGAALEADYLRFVRQW